MPWKALAGVLVPGLLQEVVRHVLPVPERMLAHKSHRCKEVTAGCSAHEVSSADSRSQRF